MADYEAISKVIRNAIRKEVDKQIEDAYKKAYEAGLDDGMECGRNEAWELAKKIEKIDEDCEYNFAFDGDLAFEILQKYSASEAIAKIKEYEEKQTEKQTEYVCNTCKHGEGEGCDSPIYCDDNNSGYEPKQTNSYRNNKYYNTFPTSKETADKIKVEYDEETRSYAYIVEGGGRMTKEEAKNYIENVFPVLSAKMQEAIKTLLQEAKTGQWVLTMPRGAEEWCYKCSKCGFWKYRKIIDLSKLNYCPNCGANMTFSVRRKRNEM